MRVALGHSDLAQPDSAMTSGLNDDPGVTARSSHPDPTTPRPLPGWIIRVAHDK
jgi:hypothetical protein